jgi:hypothetical protein
MVVVAVRLERLVPCDAVACVDPLHQPKIGERVESPVDAGEPDRTLRRAQPVEDLLGAEAAVLPRQEGDDGLAGAAASIAGAAEDAADMAGPFHGCSVSWAR